MADGDPISETLPESATRLLPDIWRLAASLDAVTTRDDLNSIRRVFDQGKEEYHRLRCRALLMSDPTDAALIEGALERIRARLKFLDGLRRYV